MHKLDASTRVFFIVADPIKQVKAPALFNQVFAHFGVNAVMAPLQVRAEVLLDTLRSLLSSPSVGGIALSIPHKTSAIALCTTMTPLAAQAQAANALRRGDDGAIEGALFDGLGLAGALRQAEFAYADKRVLIIGAGGAASAIVASLHAQTRYLAVYDPDTPRSRALVRRFAGSGGGELAVAASNDPQGYELVINASPLGMQADDELPADPARMASDCKVFDIVMQAPPTPWVSLARQYGLAACNGSAMLSQQMPHYLRFFGYPQLADAIERDDTPLSTI